MGIARAMRASDPQGVSTRARLALLLALALPACGGGDDGRESAPAQETPPAQTASTEPSEPITIDLREVKDSGQSGTATLIPRSVGEIETFDVQIEISPGVASPQMAHVHGLTCAEYAKINDFDAQIATVQSPLADVRDGRSESHNVSGSIASGDRSINVHEPAHPFPAVVCGDIPGAAD
jgi:hypothetical protein